MPQRQHDGLNLAIGLGLLTLGLVMVFYTTGGRNPGNLFAPHPTEPAWLNTFLNWEETAAFGASVALTGAVLLWYELGGRLPSVARVVLLWGVCVLLADLTFYRAIGFGTARNPPWWGMVWLFGLSVAFTVRRVGDLYHTWRS